DSAAGAPPHLVESRCALPAIRADAAPERARGDLSVPLLFTPGPLTTSRAVKEAMLRDLGSRDAEFIELVAHLRERLLAIVEPLSSGAFETVLLQGSGTYAVEAMIGTFVSPSGRLLVVDNGAYGARMFQIARVLRVRARA